MDETLPKSYLHLCVLDDASLDFVVSYERATQWRCEVDPEDPPLFAGGRKLGGWHRRMGLERLLCD